MGWIRDLFGGFSGNKGSGRDGLRSNEATSAGAQVAYDEPIDDELPSVNRYRRGNMVGTTMGYVLLFGGGAFMLYHILSPTKKPEVTEKPPQVVNILPKLEVKDLLPAPAQKPPEPIPAPDAKPIDVIAKPSQNSPRLPRQPDWTDRKMGGSTMNNAAPNGGVMTTSAQSAPLMDTTKSAEKSPAESTWLAVKLKPIATPDAYAKLLPDRDYLITKGTSLDCALETAIDSTLSGMTTCRLTRDIYSDNGHVVLLDRGSQLVGEYQGGLAQGQARIFILWTRAKTPNGIIIPLDSPGTDALGRSGHEGFVDNHFFQRFGAAVIYSLIRDSLIIAQRNNNTSISIGGNGTDAVALEMLKSTVNIPPTLNINQGEHIQIMVARDLDFSSVYSLDLKE